MSIVNRVAETIVSRRRIVLAVLLVSTMIIGSGAGMLESSSTFDPIGSETTVVEKDNYVQDNFTTREGNTTTALFVVRNDDGNVLSRDSLLRTLRFQQAIRTNETVNETLVENRSTIGIENIVAVTAMADDLEDRAEELQIALNETRDLQAEYEALNASFDRGEIDEATYHERATEIERSFASVQYSATSDLTAEQADQFNASAREVRALTREGSELEAEFERGEIDESTYRERSQALANETSDAYRAGTSEVFEERLEMLRDSDRLPPLDEQIDQLESMNAAQVEDVVERLLAEDSERTGSQVATNMLPSDFEAGSTTADARQVVVTFRTEKVIREPGSIADPIVDGHVTAREIAHAQPGPETYVAFGSAFIPAKMTDAITDSFAIIGPMAFLFVFVALTIAYRDPLDIVLGLVGVVLVLIWTFGLMGWAGIAFNQVMLAVPILLIALSVDFAFHMLMRYREERARADVDVRTAMVRALAGVGAALMLVTVTTMIGFLSNLTSPINDMQDFGVITAVGIGSTLLVFGVIIPILKLEFDGFLEARGFDRSKRAFGSSGQLGRALSVGSSVARRIPLAVVVLALLLSVAGVYGATNIEPDFSDEAVMADDPPEWTENLPEALQPGEFYLLENREYIFSNFETENNRVHLLVEGNVTGPGTLEQVDATRTAASEADVTFVRDGGPSVVTPLTEMERIAERNESFNATYHEADTTGDGIPDRSISAVYDSFYAAAPDTASQYLHRTDDGDYAALRVEVAVNGAADPVEIHDQMSAIATDFESGAMARGSTGDVTVTATGEPIIMKESDELMSTAIVEALAVTLVALLVLLIVVFRVSSGSWSLGVVTLVPVLFSVSWLLGTMFVLGLPFSFVTSVVGSVALGLGVDYTIHISERFDQEFEATRNAAVALERTVRGTGGALLGSAATTAAGFGVLAFALLPALREFGLILAIGVFYSFLASVLVLPSMLVLWSRYAPSAPATEPNPNRESAISDD